ncbi:hypothetical protein SLS58_004043 [Diplodia intermedia]|uniref:Uncharacterized protein n=1 Tax=Diplodia intermedia TaxID=856260 RepID=A0ABR3TUJ4_9PEZI
MPSPEQPPRRPAGPKRNQSSQSHVSQSPSDGQPQGQQHPKQQHKAQRHVVGHGRMGPRNPSYKNLSKAGAQRPPTGDGSTRNHQRTLSGSSTPVPAEVQAVRPGLKRNATASAVPRSTSHVVLKKNHSSTHLPRQMSTKSMHKHRTSSDLETLKRAHKQRSRQVSPDPEPDHPAVRFDLGDDDGAEDDNDWTEESASQSPATTRSNTRQNSVVLEPHKQAFSAQQQQKQQQQQKKQQQQQQQQQQLQQQQDASDDDTDTDTDESTETDAPKRRARTQPHSRSTSHPGSPSSRRDADRVTYSSNQINGASSYHQPNLPDADMITSRILQRSASHSLRPQVSDVSATVVSDSHDARSLSHSTGSTMIDTPSGNKEAVSRFIDGDGSSGTPRDSSILPHHPKGSGGEITPGKRNKSVPNMTDREPSTKHRRHVSSGTATPTDLHPSRTQQKLWLQRASSNIEPQQKEYLPRNGHSTSQLYPAGVTYTPSGEVVIDRELLRRFDEAASEYKVVRRFRNPVADAIARLPEIPSSSRKNRNSLSVKSGGAQQRPSTNAGPGPDSGVSGLVRQHSLRASSAGEGMDRERGTPTSVTEAVAAARRARVSFDLPGRGDSPQDRVAVEKDEIEEICRRIWERNELPEGE